MTHRALALLRLSSPSLVLDIGCGSGLSGEILSSSDHVWVGMDVSASMLAIALQRDVEGDLLLSDIGQGIPLRPGSMDAAISISAIQWLCNAESKDDSPEMRLKRFFGGLYSALRRGGRAVCQFYPKDDTQRSMITSAAIRAGFGAGVLEDDGGTKNAKCYLCLCVGGDVRDMVGGMEEVEMEVRAGTRNKGKKGKMVKGDEGRVGSREWVMRKKEKMERRGKVVKKDSKYTGRKRIRPPT